MSLIKLFVLAFVFLFLLCSFLFEPSSFSIHSIDDTIHFIDRETFPFSGNDSPSVRFISQCKFHCVIDIVTVKGVAQGEVKCNSGFLAWGLYHIEKSDSSVRHVKGTTHIPLELCNLIENDACSSAELIPFQQIEHFIGSLISFRDNVIKPTACRGYGLIILPGYLSQVSEPSNDSGNIGFHDVIEQIVVLTLLKLLWVLFPDHIFDHITLLPQFVSFHVLCIKTLFSVLVLLGGDFKCDFDLGLHL